MDMHYLAATQGGVEHIRERYRLRLFTPDEYRDAFRRAGLTLIDAPDADVMGHGLHLGRQRSPS